MNRKLLDYLLNNNVVDYAQLRGAVSKQRRQGGNLLDILIDTHTISDVEMARSLGAVFDYKVVDIGRVHPQQEALDRASSEFCRKHVLLPFAVDRYTDELLVAIVDPARAIPILNALQSRVGMKIRPYVAPKFAMLEAIDLHTRKTGTGSLGLFDDSGIPGEVSSMSMVPGLGDTHIGGREPTGTISQFPLGGGVDEINDLERFFNSDSGSTAAYSRRSSSELFEFSEPERGPRSEPTLTSLLGEAPRDSGAFAREDASALQKENAALRQQVERLELTLQLEINLIRQLVELLLESGAIDRATYLEKMGRLR